MSLASMRKDKRRYRAYLARVAQLPQAYQISVEAIARYLMYTGPGDGADLLPMLEDLLDLFEQSAASATPISAIVGDDPLAFVEEFRSNYRAGGWLSKEQQRLLDAIARGQALQSGSPS